MIEQENLGLPLETSLETSLTVSAEDLLNRNITSIPCLVEPFLQKVGLACIGGSSDTGKSSFLRFLCLSIVSGKSDFIGFSLNAEHKREYMFQQKMMNGLFLFFLISKMQI